MTPAARARARRASAMADAADPGSLERRAAGVASVALSTTRTPAGALRVITDYARDGADAEMCAEAEQIIHDLTNDPEEDQ